MDQRLDKQVARFQVQQEVFVTEDRETSKAKALIQLLYRQDQVSTTYYPPAQIQISPNRLDSSHNSTQTQDIQQAEPNEERTARNGRGPGR